MGIARVIPQLRTTDLAGSIRFYTETVGFTLDFQYEDFYAGIRAGGQVFHLKLADEKIRRSTSWIGAVTSTSTESDDAAADAEGWPDVGSPSSRPCTRTPGGRASSSSGTIRAIPSTSVNR